MERGAKALPAVQCFPAAEYNSTSKDVRVNSQEIVLSTRLSGQTQTQGISQA